MSDIYQHYRKSEHAFVDRVLDWQRHVEDVYVETLTPFLNPREQQIAKQIIGQYGDVKLASFGGFTAAEQQRVAFYPPYREPADLNFQVQVFRICYPQQFKTLTHPEVLGALMGLDLARSCFGDIVIFDGDVQFATEAELAPFLKQEFQQVGRIGIKLEGVPRAEINPATASGEWGTILLSSWRLDAVLAEGFHLSRQKAKKAIQAGLVKVNWAEISNPAYPLAVGDLLSFRGHGRLSLGEEQGRTRKDRYIIAVKRQIRR